MGWRDEGNGAPAGAARALAAVPPAIPGEAHGGVRRPPPQLLRHFFGDHALLADTQAFATHLAPLRRSEWVVYSKRPFGGPEAVLAYLSPRREYFSTVRSGPSFRAVVMSRYSEVVVLLRPNQAAQPAFVPRLWPIVGPFPPSEEPIAPLQRQSLHRRLRWTERNIVDRRKWSRWICRRPASRRIGSIKRFGAPPARWPKILPLRWSITARRWRC